MSSLKDKLWRKQPPKAEPTKDNDDRYVVVAWCKNCLSHMRIRIPKGVKFIETDQICPKCNCEGIIAIRPGEGI